MNSMWGVLILFAMIAFFMVQSKKGNRRNSRVLSNLSSNESETISGRTTLTLSLVPDGKYLVKYVDEHTSGNDTIYIVFEVVKGANAGDRIAWKVEGPKARRVIKTSTGGFISRLEYEGVALASKIDTNMIVGDMSDGFLVRTEGGYVVSAYTIDEDELRRFANRLNSDPEYRGEVQPREKRETVLKPHEAATFTLELVSTPEDADQTVRGSEESYRVNLFKMTCTCQDFQKKARLQFAKTDIRRPCKHLLKLLLKKGLLKEPDELTRSILDWLPSGKHFAINHMMSGEAIVFCYGRNDWIDVFARKRRKGDGDGHYTGGYDRFGFNVIENRWSYGSGPPGALEIREMIKALNYQPPVSSDE